MFCFWVWLRVGWVVVLVVGVFDFVASGCEFGVGFGCFVVGGFFGVGLLVLVFFLCSFRLLLLQTLWVGGFVVVFVVGGFVCVCVGCGLCVFVLGGVWVVGIWVCQVGGFWWFFVFVLGFGELDGVGII